MNCWSINYRSAAGQGLTLSKRIPLDADPNVIVAELRAAGRHVLSVSRIENDVQVSCRRVR